MIIDFQRIQWYFAESAAEIDAARFVSYQAARDLDGGGAPRARHAHPTDRRPDPPPIGGPGRTGRGARHTGPDRTAGRGALPLGDAATPLRSPWSPPASGVSSVSAGPPQLLVCVDGNPVGRGDLGRRSVRGELPGHRSRGPGMRVRRPDRRSRGPFRPGRLGRRPRRHSAAARRARRHRGTPTFALRGPGRGRDRQDGPTTRRRCYR